MRIIRYIFYILVVSVISSCSDGYSDGLITSENPRYLNIANNSLTFANTSGSAAIDIQSMNVAWSLRCNANWVHINPASGTSSAMVDVSVDENTKYETDGREAFITLSGDDMAMRYINIHQRSPSLLLSCSTTDVVIDAKDASEAQVYVTCNSTWEVNVGDNTWLSAIKSDGGYFTLRAKENTTGVSRSTIVTVTSEKMSQIVKVTQKAANLPDTPDVIYFESEEYSQSVDIVSEVSWTAKTNDSWIDITPDKGYAGKTTITVGVKKNKTKESRTGHISVNNKEVKVIQYGVTSTETSLATFIKEGETRDLTLINTDNTNSWTADTSYPWIHVSPKSGNSGSIINITVDPTNVVDDREGYFTITWNTGNKDVYRVVQRGYGIKPSQTSCDFFAKGGTYSITVESKGRLKATTSDSRWLSAVISGNILTVTAKENFTGSVRNGVITLQQEGDERKVDINVVQGGQHGTINVEDYSGTTSSALPNFTLTLNGVVIDNSSYGTGDVNLNP